MSHISPVPADATESSDEANSTRGVPSSPSILTSTRVRWYGYAAAAVVPHDVMVLPSRAAKRLSVASSTDSTIDCGAYTLMLAEALKPADATSSVAADRPDAALSSPTETTQEEVSSEYGMGDGGGAGTCERRPPSPLPLLRGGGAGFGEVMPSPLPTGGDGGGGDGEGGKRGEKGGGAGTGVVLPIPYPLLAIGGGDGDGDLAP